MRTAAVLLLGSLLLMTGASPAQPPRPPARPSPSDPAYPDLIKKSILRDYPGMLHEPTGSLAYPFLTPGSVYAKELWDWDSWLSDLALLQILTDQGVDRAKMLSYGQGCILNFLAAAGPDGSIPIRIKVARPSAPKTAPATAATQPALPPFPPYRSNIHKPVLAQHAAMLVKLADGDAAWLRDRFATLQAFQRYYREHQFHTPTGLYFWADDLAIGVDNDPATFFRPPNSSGNIFLNCLMFKELEAMAYLATRLQLDPAIAAGYQQQAGDLKAAIQKHCWDERDGYFYSVDLNLRPITKQPGEYLGDRFVLHKGHPRDYDCLIQRLEGWSGFMAMWAGIATPEQARRMVEEHLKNPRTLGAPYGIRSLSKMEKMYGIYASSNPSDWNGPIWGISNYLVYRGLVRYGFDAEAQVMASKTIALFGRDFAQNGALHEYYDPDSGAPIMNKGFQNWNYLVMNMLARQERRKVVEEF